VGIRVTNGKNRRGNADKTCNKIRFAFKEIKKKKSRKLE
jgi:hypothetical protein